MNYNYEREDTVVAKIISKALLLATNKRVYKTVAVAEKEIGSYSSTPPGYCTSGPPLQVELGMRMHCYHKEWFVSKVFPHGVGMRTAEIFMTVLTVERYGIGDLSISKIHM